MSDFAPYVFCIDISVFPYSRANFHWLVFTLYKWSREINMFDAQPIRGACVWNGAEIVDSTRWLRDLPPEVASAIDRSVSSVAGMDWKQIKRGDFPMPGCEAFFDDVREELENGSGMVKIRGLDVGRYSMEQLRSIWFGLGTHFGQPIFQNRRGELMREIRDEGGDIGKKYGETLDDQGKQFLSSSARTLSPGALRFHTDRCDVVGLLCVRQAKTGGVSKLCSAATVYNVMRERRPDLLQLLCSPIPRSRFGEEAGGDHLVYELPVFGVRGGKLTTHFSLTYIESAQQMAHARKLTSAEWEAIDLLLKLAEEFAFEMRLEPGVIQLINNNVIYHGRTAFEDDASQGSDRLLMRLWLAMPNSRALPDDHAVLWGNVAAGAMRGGIAQEMV
jgi:hypothetical protein